MPQPQVVVIGGGQAGLAVGFYLRRAGLTPGQDFVILDAAESPGGAWQHMWDGLRLFSPATYSSLPGWMMPAWDDSILGYPPRDHVVAYLRAYEERYSLDVVRPQRVQAVTRADTGDRLIVRTDTLSLSAKVVVSATGTWSQPFWPAYPGSRVFAGRQLHAANYRRPEDFAGERVVVVGGGNSGAQILAEISRVAETTWVTPRPPRFLPDDVDGRALFEAASARIRALSRGEEHPGVGGLGDVVMVASMREARDRGALTSRRPFSRFTPSGVLWPDGSETPVDTVVWCTGFRPALRHVRPLGLRDHGGGVPVNGPSGTRANAEPRLYFVGYGDWTGLASATLVGVGQSARATATQVVAALSR